MNIQNKFMELNKTDYKILYNQFRIETYEDYCFPIKKYYESEYECKNCKKHCGESEKSCVERCRKEKYNKYIYDTDECVFNANCPCFYTFWFRYCNEDKKLESYLKENNLEVIVDDKKFDSNLRLKNYIMQCDFKPKFKFHFNRKLTFDEWKFLNIDCFVVNQNEDNQNFMCYVQDENFTKINIIAKQFILNGYDVDLKYCCDECCLNNIGLFKLEFKLKAKNQEDYVVSYPKFSDHTICNFYPQFCDIDDYYAVLDFLKNETSYEELYKKYNMSKFEVDSALEKIIGCEIYYTKKQVLEYSNFIFDEIYKTSKSGNDEKLEITKKLIRNLIVECLRSQKDNDKILPSQFVMLVKIANMFGKGVLNEKLDFVSRYELILKMIKCFVFGCKEKFYKNEILNLNRLYFPSIFYEDFDENYKKSDDYELASNNNTIRKFIMTIFDNIYKEFGENFCISIQKYYQIIEFLSRNYDHCQFIGYKSGNYNGCFCEPDKFYNKVKAFVMM